MSGRICTTVALETECVLRRLYGLSPDECAKVLTAFAGLSRVTLEGKALEWMRQGLDFADGLHLAGADGCDAFISLDQDLAKAANRLGGIRVRAP